MSVITLPGLAAWGVLEEALRTRRPVALRYHGQDRVACPHALGLKAGRARVLAYQVDGATSRASAPEQRWRCLFVDEVEQAAIVDGSWATASNYAPTAANGIDYLVLAVEPSR